MVASVFLFYFCSPGLALCRHYVHANNTGAHTHVACLCCRHCPVIECLSALLGAPVFASSRAVSFPCGLFAGQESRLALARCKFVCASLHRLRVSVTSRDIACCEVFPSMSRPHSREVRISVFEPTCQRNKNKRFGSSFKHVMAFFVLLASRT